MTVAISRAPTGLDGIFGQLLEIMFLLFLGVEIHFNTVAPPPVIKT